MLTVTFTCSRCGAEEVIRDPDRIERPAGWRFDLDAADLLCPACGPMADDCASCEQRDPLNECPKARRPCGHHCNHIWTDDRCHWCGHEDREEEEEPLTG